MGKAKKKKADGNMGASKPKEKMTATSQTLNNEKPVDNSYTTDIFSPLWKPVTIATLVLGLYIQTLHPSLPGGDSGELIVAASEFGVAHPPGYPLFTVLAQCMLEFFPLGSPAWRVNLLSAITSAASAGLLFSTVERLTCRASAGLLVVALFSFSRLTWMWSVTSEVFGLNNFFIALLLFLSVKFEQAQDKKTSQLLALLGSFTCGLCLCNQHTSVLYILCIVPWVLTILYSTKMLSVMLLLKLCVMLLLGLLPYIYIPVSAYTHAARWTWGDQRTIMGFLTHLLRMEYGTFDLLKEHSGQGLLHGVRSYVEHIYTDLTPVGFLLAIFSVLAAVKRLQHHHVKSTSVCIFYLMLLTYTVFFGWRANLDVNNPLLLGVVERFWLQGDLVVAVLAAVTFVDFMDMVVWLIDLHKWRLDLLFTVLLALFQLHRNYRQCDQSNNYIIRDFAMSVLNSLPPGSIVLTKGDLPSNTFRYFHLCENVRPDLTLFDQEVLTYKWSVNMMRDFHSGIVFPGDFMQLENGIVEDGKMSFTFTALLDANIDKHPVFGCIGVQDHEPSWHHSYELWPYGVCSQFIQKGSTLDLSLWINNTKEFGFDWKYHHEGFPDTSWENVASGEMWAAKTASAFFLLEKSDTYDPGPEKTAMLLYTFQLYSKAHRRHPSVPSYWNKNFAVASERLFHTDVDLDKAELIEICIQQFRIYMKKEPKDPQYDKIKKAVSTLQKYLQQLRDTS